MEPQRPPGQRHRIGPGSVALLGAALALVVGLGLYIDVLMNEHPRDDEISSTIDGIWEAVGVDADDVWTSPYDRDEKRSSTGCAGLPEDDRWIAFRTSRVPGERYPQDRQWERANDYVADHGYGDVARYRSPSGRLTLRATKGQLVVYVDVSTNGATHLEVVSGPCAPRMGSGPPRAGEPMDS